MIDTVDTRAHSLNIRPAAPHQGRNLKRFREMMGIKQDILAFELGEEWSQKRISLLETRPVIESQVLEEISAKLKIPADAIRNFDEARAMRHIQDSYASLQAPAATPICNFNPFEKLLETLESLVILHEENKILYERLLAAEKEKLYLLTSEQRIKKPPLKNGGGLIC